MTKAVDFTGNRFGKLVVTSRITTHKKGPHWFCVCDCGRTTEVSSANLKNGHVTSCGCVRRRHGMEGSKTYHAWQGMKARCYNENCPAWKDYGARGIKVCDEWLADFINFYRDMGEGKVGLTLERLDVNGDYCIENCCWATWKVQNRNKRDREIYTIRGFTGTVSAIIEHFELPVSTQLVYQRKTKRGWSVEDSLFNPIDVEQSRRSKGRPKHGKQ